MADPTIAAKEPAPVKVEAGRAYVWCSCGTSKKQPLCDGTHKGGPFMPIIFRPDETKEVLLCQCKRSGTKPFCDGTHKTL